MADTNKIFDGAKNSNTINNVVPTNENVELRTIYVYDEFIPEFGKFEEEKVKYNPKHATELADIMVNGNWKGDVRIIVDINTMNVVQHNHTYGGYKEAKEKGFGKPLTVEYIDLDPKELMKYLLVDEKITKWTPEKALKANMSKDGKPKNSYRRVYDYCMGHDFLHKGESIRLSYGLIALLGDSKTYTKQIKDAEFNLRHTNVDFTDYTILNKAIEVKKNAGLEKANSGTWLESYLRVFYRFYNKNKSYLNLNRGWNEYLSAVEDVTLAFGGLVQQQNDKYYELFFNNILAIATKQMTSEEVKESFEVFMKNFNK